MSAHIAILIVVERPPIGSWTVTRCDCQRICTRYVESSRNCWSISITFGHVNIWSNRHLTSPRDIEWHRFQLHKHRSRWNIFEGERPFTLISGVRSFSSHLRQQNCVIFLGHFGKKCRCHGREPCLKRDSEMPLLSAGCPVCVKLRIVCQGKIDLRSRARGSIHICAFLFGAQFQLKLFNFLHVCTDDFSHPDRASHPSMPLCYAKRPYADFGRAMWTIQLIFQTHDIFIKLGVLLTLLLSLFVSLFSAIRYARLL